MVTLPPYPTLPVLRVGPVEAVRLNDAGQPCLVGEEEGQVGGEDAVLHVPQDLLVLVWTQLGEDVVILLDKSVYSYSIHR